MASQPVTAISTPAGCRMSELARVHVRGPGLFVVEANTAALSVTRRELVGIPLVESMGEPMYHEAIDRIRWTMTTLEATETLVRAPDGTLGRVVADPTFEGAIATFRPVAFPMQSLVGPDLVMLRGNAAFDACVGREYIGIAAREAFPEAVYEPAQDAMRWVMRSGADLTVRLPRGLMAIRRQAPHRIRTIARLDLVPGLVQGSARGHLGLHLAGPETWRRRGAHGRSVVG